ncbi:hypothetical protein SBV1_1520031 [Verrucomicrobia bacterium]|nr:hypothetical protein SBV1_1520031 [Verrucomicrobiota bacterium]
MAGWRLSYGRVAARHRRQTGNGLVFRLILPLFLSQSLARTNATAGQPYAGSISNSAVGPAGDPLTFAKSSGRPVAGDRAQHLLVVQGVRC